MVQYLLFHNVRAEDAYLVLKESQKKDCHKIWTLCAACYMEGMGASTYEEQILWYYDSHCMIHLQGISSNSDNNAKHEQMVGYNFFNYKQT